MFNSIANNFGAGVIRFKDVHESNYIVLNAKFTCNPQIPEYQAAEVLEISVPALSIARSTEAGVVVRFKDRRNYYGNTYIYDGGTVAKSWVKDANTICIEKLSCFDDQTELIIYIQTLYCMLGQGGNAIAGKEKRITCVSDDNYLRLDTTYTFCVVFKKWAFYHMMYGSSTFAMRDADWEAFLEGLPEDIDAEVPVITGSNTLYSHLGGITESRLEGGYFSLPASERDLGFDNTGNYVFSFAYLIRDYVDEQDAEGRLHYENEQLQAGKSEYFNNFDLEMSGNLAGAACSGSVGVYKQGPLTFTAPDFQEAMPEFEAFFLAAHQHSNGLTVQLLGVKVTKSGGNGNIQVTDLSGDKNLSFKLFDTALAMQA